MKTTPLQEYLRATREIRARGGTQETAHYGALETLFNAVGREHKVRFVLHPGKSSAGIPDGGFFSVRQLPRHVEQSARASMWSKTPPERGVAEVKPAKDDLDKVARSEQVVGYAQEYGQVLVTNLRAFVIVQRDGQGGVKLLERYELAPSEAAFWGEPVDALVARHQDGLDNYLGRVFQGNVALREAKDVAQFLASYAREARRLVSGVDLEALNDLQAALEEALDVSFQGQKGGHFFRSTLIQTLFYGVFAAWVLWAKNPRNERASFDWRTAAWHLEVPVIRAILGRLVQPGPIQDLGLTDVLDWTGDMLNRVERGEFFQTFRQESAVQYFYEPFLEAFDPELRKELGVWYTPMEVVEYQVERVDRALREQLGLPLGLADERVRVLDPCCGTGAYVLAVLKRIAKTLHEEGDEAMAPALLKRAALSRVFGFEILPAPLVIAHLQVGLLLQDQKTPLQPQRQERAAIYLTNALTGWEPDPQQRPFPLPEFAQERDSAANVKREQPIWVILGNPPYNAYAGVDTSDEGNLTQAYKEGLSKRWGVKKFNLDDLYIRFFRVAERRIVERAEPGQGVVCFISNSSYLEGASFVAMRERLLQSFDHLWFDNLNGASREADKKTPDGKPDPSIFSTPYNKEGIKVGTALCLLVRQNQRAEAPTVRVRQLWGERKREELLASLRLPSIEAAYSVACPTEESKYAFRKAFEDDLYASWPSVLELCQFSSWGLMEKRYSALIDDDPEKLKKRMIQYFDRSVGWDELVAENHPLTKSASDFSAQSFREKILNKEDFDNKMIVKYKSFPMDVSWCYYSKSTSFWNRNRPELFEQLYEGSRFLLTRKLMANVQQEGKPFYVSRWIADDHIIKKNAKIIPFDLIQSSSSKGNTLDIFDSGAVSVRRPNFSEFAFQYFRGLEARAGRSLDASWLWWHVLAVGWSEAYLERHAEGVRADCPRVPLPRSVERLEASARLGQRIGALLDTESALEGVTHRPNEGLKVLGGLARVDGSVLNPDEGHLRVDVGWGVLQPNGIMGGGGRVEVRPLGGQERAVLEREYGREACRLLGGEVLDVFLNGATCWRNVPRAVWEYRIGGYQVLKKWLSYREYKVLGRDLSLEEARAVTGMVRRLAALVLMEPALGDNYREAAWDAWPVGLVEGLLDVEWKDAPLDHRRLRGAYFERMGREGGSPSAVAERRCLMDIGFEALGRWEALKAGAMTEEALDQVDLLAVALKHDDDGLLWRRLTGLWRGWSARELMNLLDALFSFEVAIPQAFVQEVAALCRHESRLLARVAGVWLYRFAEDGAARLEGQRLAAEGDGDAERSRMLGEVLEVERGGGER